jgi:hypothetical protein
LEGVLQMATSANVADMRRRPSLSIRWKPHCRRLFSMCFPGLPKILRNAKSIQARIPIFIDINHPSSKQFLS